MAMTHTFTTNSAVELPWAGSEGQVATQGDFDGCTLALEYSLDDGTTWTQLEDDPASTLSAAGSFSFKSMKAGDPSYRLRLSLTGAGSPNINLRVGGHL